MVNVVGTGGFRFSFDAPVVSFGPYNGATTGAAATVSLLGLNFAHVDATPSFVVDHAHTVAWMSDSSIAAVPRERILTDTHMVTVAAVGGTLLVGFTYDTPVRSPVWSTELLSSHNFMGHNCYRP